MLEVRTKCFTVGQIATKLASKLAGGSILSDTCEAGEKKKIKAIREALGEILVFFPALLPQKPYDSLT